MIRFNYAIAILLSNELLHHMNFLHATIKQKGDRYGTTNHGSVKENATSLGGRGTPGALECAAHGIRWVRRRTKDRGTMRG